MGGIHPRACRDSHPDPCNDQGEWEEERKTDKQRAMARCGERKKGGGSEERKTTTKKKNVGWPVLIFLAGETKDTARKGEGGLALVGGCQSGKGASCICHLSFTLRSSYLSLPPFPSFHASVLLFPAPRGSAATANKQKEIVYSRQWGITVHY